MIRQNNKYKLLWDLAILALLMAVCLIVPWRLAFSDAEDKTYLIFYIVTDSLFLIDIILTFFTTVTDT